MRRALGVRSSAQPASVQRSHALAPCLASCAAPCGCGPLRGAVAEPVLVFVSGAVVFAAVAGGHHNTKWRMVGRKPRSSLQPFRRRPAEPQAVSAATTLPSHCLRAPSSLEAPPPTGGNSAAGPQQIGAWNGGAPEGGPSAAQLLNWMYGSSPVVPG
jgi:hypothetical protein